MSLGQMCSEYADPLLLRDLVTYKCLSASWWVLHHKSDHRSWQTGQPLRLESCLVLSSVPGSMRVQSPVSHVWLFTNLWIVAHQPPLSTGFSRQEYWSGLPCPSPGDLPNPGMEPASLASSALAGKFFTTSPNGEALDKGCINLKGSENGL